MATAVATGRAQPTGKLLRSVRAVWFVLIGILFVFFLISIPFTYTSLTQVCVTGDSECVSWAQVPQESLDVLQELHISLQAFAAFNLLIFVAFSLFCWFAGLLVLRYRSHDWHGLLVSYLLIALAAGGPSFVFMSSWDTTDVPGMVAMVPGLTIFPMYLALSLFFQSFPDGKIYPRWTRAGTIIILANYAVWIGPAPLNLQYWPPPIPALWLLFVYGSHVMIQVYRFRHYYTREQRQQTKWLVLGAGIALMTAILGGIFLDPAHGELLEGVLTTFGFYLPIAAGVTVAILRYRLWDIDIIINRTVVYALLSAVIVGVYAVIVSALGSLVQDRSSFGVSLIGAGAVAVTFQPMRMSLQRGVNRVMFGKRDEPIAVMSELGKALDSMLSPASALSYLAERTSQTLKLPYVAVTDSLGNQTITYGAPRGTPEHIPLIHHGTLIGELVTCARSANERLNAADKVVLENVARQASSVIYSARLASDLQESRQRIVTAREEERRRLRRDLHDGLGPTLAAITLQAEAARDVLSENPAKTTAILNTIIDRSQDALADIRRVVYALRPPALDDLGLMAAIREVAANYSTRSLQVTVAAPDSLPALPAAVEVAAYRIIQEALANVARHAQARTCRITMEIDSELRIAIEDDGRGIPAEHVAGVGLNSMHERAAELGGVVEVDSRPGAGTRIRTRLPLGAPSD